MVPSVAELLLGEMILPRSASTAVIAWSQASDGSGPVDRAHRS
jgi:hypothetical protein